MDETKVTAIETCDKTSEAKELVKAQRKLARSAKKETETLRVINRKSQGTKMSNVVQSDIYWILEGWLALGTVNMITGKADIGKSFLTCDIASHVTTGRNWFNGSECEKGNVLLIALEDSASNTLYKRLQDCGTDMDRITNLSSVSRENIHVTGTQQEVPFSLPEDMERLEHEIIANHITLVIMDPISAIFDNYENNPYVRKHIMNPLTSMANRLGVCILLINHPKKGKYNEENVETWIGGAQSIHAACRGSFILTKDKGNPDVRNLQQVKMNIGKKQPMISYEIVEDVKGRVFVSYLPQEEIVTPSTNNPKLSQVENKIMAYMYMQVETVSPSQIAQETGIKADSVRPTIKRLEDDNMVEKIMSGQYQVTNYALSLAGLKRAIKQ